MFELKPLPRSLAAALRDVTSPKEAVRASAIADLTRHARSGERAAAEALVRALEDPAEAVQAAAAMGLADADWAAALPDLVQKARSEAPVKVKQMALLAIGELAEQDPELERAVAPEQLSEALSVLQEAQRAEAAPERFQSLLALHQLRAPGTRAALIEASVDPDAEVRRLAFRIAEAEWAEQELPEILRARARSALGDSNPSVRIAAALLLGRFGDPSGSGVLLGLVRHEWPSATLEDQQAGIELCSVLGLREAIPALERRAFSLWRDALAFDARVALARLGHERARAEIVRGLSGFTFRTRTLAAIAAGRARLHEALPILERLAREPTRADATAVNEALAALGTSAPSSRDSSAELPARDEKS